MFKMREEQSTEEEEEEGEGADAVWWWWAASAATQTDIMAASVKAREKFDATIVGRGNSGGNNWV